ncbi:hypothetical protein SAMN04488508_105268 [Aquimarina spongiae]|uniref:Uncharacterized protein n=1 Tax=Aquimarina spongiae TaxID=570521 RepID=A0A1M6GGK2_9FLAO|nr:hypothetical protein SAMN04488508_105268 [Aquimarina spongiae]
MKKPRNAHLKRVIVDYKKLNNDILDLLVTKYPDGYNDEDIITFRNAKNEIVECVEVKTEDTLYLVKVSKRLVTAMEDHDEDDESNNQKEQDIPDESEMEEE